MAVTVRGRGPAALENVEILLTEFRTHKSMVTEISERIASVRARLMTVLERRGEVDERGSTWMTFEDPVAGYASIKRERRSKIWLDTERATKILKEHGCYEQAADVDITLDAEHAEAVLSVLKEAKVEHLITVTERLNDDKIMALHYLDPPKLSSEQIDSMFRQDISYALIVKDA